MNRKEAILEAAIRLFAEKGYNETPTSEVARTAGVAEGTVFHYFKTKEGILMHILEEMINIYLKGMEEEINGASSGMEALEKIIRFHFRISEERSKEFLVLIRDIPFNLLKPDSSYWEVVTARISLTIELLKDCIERGQRDGSIRDLPAEEAAFIMRGMLIGLCRLGLLGHLKMPDLSSEVIDFCRHGLAK